MNWFVSVLMHSLTVLPTAGIPGIYQRSPGSPLRSSREPLPWLHLSAHTPACSRWWPPCNSTSVCLTQGSPAPNYTPLRLWCFVYPSCNLSDIPYSNSSTQEPALIPPLPPISLAESQDLCLGQNSDLCVAIRGIRKASFLRNNQAYNCSSRSKWHLLSTLD